MSRQKMVWYVRQLLPLHYRSRYTDENGDRHLCVWRMWMGRPFAIDDVTVKETVHVAS